MQSSCIRKENDGKKPEYLYVYIYFEKQAHKKKKNKHI